MSDTLEINARTLGLIDLDFPQCAVALKKAIDDAFNNSMALLSLDLRWCVVIYSQAHLFLDTCLSHLVGGHAKDKRLVILTTDSYQTRELICYELFRTTIAVGIKDHDPKAVTKAVDEYCITNNLVIEVQVYSGDTEEENSPRLSSYKFPERITSE